MTRRVSAPESCIAPEHFRALARTLRRVAASIFICSSIGTVSSANAQQVVVSGVVLDQSDLAAIPEATIRLSGLPLSITDLDGRFEVAGVVPGRYALSVQALGYISREIELVVRGDTILEIELVPDPLRLDSLVVQPVTIRGSIRDAETGQKLLQGQVTLHPGSETVGTVSGDFTLEQVSRGSSVLIVAEALEHLPVRIEFIANRDTTVDIAMEVDSVALRMIARQVQKLEDRAKAMPYSANAMDRKDIEQASAPSIAELLKRQLPPDVVEWQYPYLNPRNHCILLDDVPTRYERLLGMPPGMIERIEIFGMRGRMIRVYTARYMASLIGKETLPPISYMENGLGRVCT